MRRDVLKVTSYHFVDEIRIEPCNSLPEYFIFRNNICVGLVKTKELAEYLFPDPDPEDNEDVI